MDLKWMMLVVLPACIGGRSSIDVAAGPRMDPREDIKQIEEMNRKIVKSIELKIPFNQKDEDYKRVLHIRVSPGGAVFYLTGDNPRWWE